MGTLQLGKNRVIPNSKSDAGKKLGEKTAPYVSQIQRIEFGSVKCKLHVVVRLGKPGAIAKPPQAISSDQNNPLDESTW